jgi:hypothetical protein
MSQTFSTKSRQSKSQFKGPLPPEQYLLSRHSEARCRAYLIRLSPLRSQHQSRNVMSVDEQATGLAGEWTDGDGQKASSVRSW